MGFLLNTIQKKEKQSPVMKIKKSEKHEICATTDELEVLPLQQCKEQWKKMLRSAIVTIP